MNRKTILITGANGYVGRNLSRVIRETFGLAGVFGLDLSKGPDLGYSKLFTADIGDKKRVRKIIGEIKPDYIFHLAGIINSGDWDKLFSVNVEKTQAFLDTLARAGSGARVIIPGSAAEYGQVGKTDLPIREQQAPNPLTLYGMSKVFQTALGRFYAARGMDVVIGRIFNFVGAGMPDYLSIGTFISQIKLIRSGQSKGDIVVGNLKSKRDFLDIHDVSTGLLALARKGRPGEVYNICSGTSVTMESILKMMIRKSGVKIRIKIDPKRMKKQDINDIYGSNRKIISETGWRPTVSFASSIEKCFR
jgi:GDP-4-dehydro-6-deoxy-D-mannose reductase